MSRKHQTAPSFGIEQSEKIDSIRPSMTDDDYIHFCFKDNGTFYIVKDQKSRNSDYFKRTSTRLRRKLIYEEEEDVNNFKEDGVDLEASSGRESYDDEQVGDEESVYFDPESPVTEISEEQYYQNEYHPAISHESSTSNDSTSSFAFPVLSRVWSGSPIKMPRTAGMHLRKHKDWRLVFLCCRF